MPGRPYQATKLASAMDALSNRQSIASLGSSVDKQADAAWLDISVIGEVLSTTVVLILEESESERVGA